MNKQIFIEAITENPVLLALFAMMFMFLFRDTCKQMAIQTWEKMFGKFKQHDEPKETKVIATVTKEPFFTVEEQHPEANECVSLDLFVYLIKVVFVFNESLVVPVSQESCFMNTMLKHIDGNSEAAIVFDMTRTKIINDVVAKDITTLVDIVADGNYRLTIVLPNPDSDEILAAQCREIYQHTQKVIERTQNYHIKIKQDSYGKTSLDNKDIFIHRFFESVDMFIYYKIPDINISDVAIKKTVVALLSSYFTVYKHFMMQFMFLCHENQIQFSYTTHAKAVHRILDLSREIAIRYGAHSGSVAMFDSELHQRISDYSESHKRIFENPWRITLDDHLAPTLDMAMTLLSRAFDIAYEMSCDGKIKPSPLSDGTNVDLKKMRIEVSADAFKAEF